MNSLLYFLNIAFVFLSPFLYLLLGENIIWLLKKWCRIDPEQNVLAKPDEQTEVPWGAIALVLGLLVYLAAVFLLKIAGFPWYVVTYLPLIPAFLRPGIVKRLFAHDRLEPGLNFILWFGAIVCIGVSIFRATDGIQTPWTNNYGDLTFHLGMITSFVFGDNLPPQYHLMAGERLSYPFFMNLWSSTLWWPIPDFRSLSIIFMLQWVVLWSLVFYLLSGNVYRLLPWALLLGGGSYFTVGRNSGELIGDNGAWTVFLTTIWIPQRTAMLGACASLAALRVFFLLYARLKTLPSPAENEASRNLLEVREQQFLFCVCGLILGLSPLIHTHFFLVTLLFVSGCILWRLLNNRIWNRKYRDMMLVYIKAYMLPLCIGLIFVPWLLGKSPLTESDNVESHRAMGKIIYGWVTGSAMHGTWTETLSASAKMWIYSAPFWFATMLAVLFLTLEWGLFAVLLSLFVGFNFVQLAFWEWDQIKLFIAIYFIFLAIWASMRPAGQHGRVLFYLQLIALTLSIPAIMEVRGILTKGDLYGVYSKEEVENAAKVRLATAPDAIIQGKPDHNTLLTLTGRKLFYGYEGTLSSHGLDYQKRKDIAANLDRIATCRSDEASHPRIGPYCPDYIIWTSREKDFWSGQNMSGHYQQVIEGLLYKVRGGS